jgi:hypothetical protein
VSSVRIPHGSTKKASLSLRSGMDTLLVLGNGGCAQVNAAAEDINSTH